MKSVLHIGDIAGVPQGLSRAQSKMGLKSDVLSFSSHKFEYDIDLYYPTKLPRNLYSLRYIGGFLKRIERMTNLLKISNEYDIFHFHFSSVLPFGMDVPIWKILKKKVIIHHHGSDIRHKQEFKMYLKFADIILVSTPDLLNWSPTAIWIPNPISLDDFSYYGVGYKNKTECVNIIHAPSNRVKKGTEHVIKAINILNNEGYNIDFTLIENMPHHKAIEFYKNADIVIDQLLIGWYGVFSTECMAYGKPVCVYIHDNLESYIPFNSIINTSPKNIIENLRVLIENRTLRKDVGDNGRNYVENVHDSKKIAKRLLELYENI